MRNTKVQQMDMILFEHNWDDWPTAIMDEKTFNPTTLELCKLLKSMGIKNYRWPLTLINPHLQGVDPFSPHLTVKQMTMIQIECDINPWYVLREIIRVTNPGSAEPIRLNWNRGNAYLWWCYFNHIVTLLTQPRQTGKSIGVISLRAALMAFCCTGTKLSMITTTEKLRTEATDHLKAILGYLPGYLNPVSSADRSSGEIIEVSSRGNTYTTYLSNANPESAHRVGRGSSNANLDWEEVPFQKNLQITYGVATGSMGAHVTAAKRNNSPWGVLMVTTAGKRNTDSGKFFYAIADKAAKWNDMFFDCVDIDDLYKTIYHASRMDTPESGEDQDADQLGMVSVYAKFSHLQLGFTNQWLKDIISLNQNPVAEDINRDYFNIDSAGSESHPLEQWILDIIIDSKRETSFTQIDPKYRYVTNWYIEEKWLDAEMSARQVVASVDMSEGINKDFLTIKFIDTSSTEVLGASMVKRANINEYCVWFCDIMLRFPNLVAIIERKNMGVALIDALLVWMPIKGIDPFKRLFNRIVHEKNDSTKHMDRFKEIDMPMNRRRPNIYLDYKEYFGYNTAGTGQYSRTQLYTYTLNQVAERAAYGVHDETLINQICELTKKDDRIDHKTGKHDDAVVAWLLGLWFIYNAKNIEFYGFKHSMILNIHLAPATEDDPDLAYTESQNDWKQKFEACLKEMEQEDDENVLIHLEARLRFLEGKIDNQGSDVPTVDELLRKAAEAKRRKRIETRNKGFNQSADDYYQYQRMTQGWER